MKTLSDFKRRLRVGVKLHTIFHQATSGRDESGRLILTDEDRGVREVTKVQTNSFALRGLKNVSGDSWCEFPKASEVRIIDKDTIQILSPDFRDRNSTELIPCLTYKFIEQ